ncbi:unnamed protein product [Chrysoparadoxa australica]
MDLSLSLHEAKVELCKELSLVLLQGQGVRGEEGGAEELTCPNANVLQATLEQRLQAKREELLEREEQRLTEYIQRELAAERCAQELSWPKLVEKAYQEAAEELKLRAARKKEEDREAWKDKVRSECIENLNHEFSLRYRSEREGALAALSASLDRGASHSLSQLRKELEDEAHKSRDACIEEHRIAMAKAEQLLREMHALKLSEGRARIKEAAAQKKKALLAEAALEYEQEGG